ncbi:MAG: class I SAM-dependent methyltransferase, partial [Propionibacterium sp.]|nr:class I SAM-dependent methyltransferase [Propionibacterium sp.]
MSADPYRHNAEWYAALARPGLPAVREALAVLLPGVIPTGVVVEVGAGIGATLDSFLDAGAERIFAVEPSPEMRVGLMTRIGLDERLAPITTVLPGTLDEMSGRLPARWGALVLLNVLGHLTEVEETRMWHLV